jgi:hypothetical protein
VREPLGRSRWGACTVDRRDDPHRVRVAMPAGAGLVVEVRGPRIDVAGVGGEVADRVPGGAVAAAPVVGLVGVDHHDGEPGFEEGVDNLAVAAFDGHLIHAGEAQPAHQLAQPAPGGVDEELLGDGARVVHDRDSVIGGGPVQTSRDIGGWGFRHGDRNRWRSQVGSGRAACRPSVKRRRRARGEGGMWCDSGPRRRAQVVAVATGPGRGDL